METPAAKKLFLMRLYSTLSSKTSASKSHTDVCDRLWHKLTIRSPERYRPQKHMIAEKNNARKQQIPKSIFVPAKRRTSVAGELSGLVVPEGHFEHGRPGCVDRKCFKTCHAGAVNVSNYAHVLDFEITFECAWHFFDGRKDSREHLSSQVKASKYSPWQRPDQVVTLSTTNIAIDQTQPWG